MENVSNLCHKYSNTVKKGWIYRNQCRRMWSNFKSIGHWQRSKWVFMNHFYVRTFDNFILFFFLVPNHYQCRWLTLCMLRAHCICSVNALQCRNKNNKCANTKKKKRKLSTVNIERWGQWQRLLPKVSPSIGFSSFLPFSLPHFYRKQSNNEDKLYARNDRRYGVTSFGVCKQSCAINFPSSTPLSSLHVWRVWN